MFQILVLSIVVLAKEKSWPREFETPYEILEDEFPFREAMAEGDYFYLFVSNYPLENITLEVCQDCNDLKLVVPNINEGMPQDPASKAYHDQQLMAISTAYKFYFPEQNRHIFYLYSVVFQKICS